jgi:hypothetical protein
MTRHVNHKPRGLIVALSLAMVLGSAPAFANSVPLQELYRNRERVTAPANTADSQSDESVRTNEP